MASGNKPFSFKQLLAELPRGEPLSTSALQARGVSAFRASDLARSGWLTHLSRGVYMLPGDTLTREGCLAYLSQRVSGFHVGGKTALAWRGVRQNVSFREVLILWGDQPKRLPAWFTQRFDSRYQETQLFDAKLPNSSSKALRRRLAAAAFTVVRFTLPRRNTAMNAWIQHRFSDAERALTTTLSRQQLWD